MDNDSVSTPMNSGNVGRVYPPAPRNLVRAASSIVAIVCAYNESGQICEVLHELTACRRFREVIVIDDGSRDATADQIAHCFPTVRLIRHKLNRGKGRAMQTGVQATVSEDRVIFFCDADVLGLTSQVIDDLLEPLVRGERDMMIAQRFNMLYCVPFIRAIIPKLGGVRAVTRGLWNIVPSRYKQGYKIEAALNYIARKHGSGFGYKIVNGLAQVIKERKYGFRRGFIARIKMCCEVCWAIIQIVISERNHNRRGQPVSSACYETAASNPGVISTQRAFESTRSHARVACRALFECKFRRQSCRSFERAEGQAIAT